MQPIGGEDEAGVTKRLGAFAASASFSNRTNEAILEHFPSQPLKPLEEVTFDSSRKWSAIVCDAAPLEGLYVLGAPEVLESGLVAGSRLSEDVAAWAAYRSRDLKRRIAEILVADSGSAGPKPNGFRFAHRDDARQAGDDAADTIRSLLDGRHAEKLAAQLAKAKAYLADARYASAFFKGLGPKATFALLSRVRGNDLLIVGRALALAQKDQKLGKPFFDRVLAAAKRQAAALYSFSKGSSTQDYPTSLMGAIALLRQNFLDAQWYKSGGYKKEYNIGLDAWNKNSDLPEVFEANDKLNILRANKIAQEFGVQYIIKGGGNEYERVTGP